MSTLTTETPDTVYQVINDKIIAWKAAVKAQVEAAIVAADSATINQTMTDTNKQSVGIGTIVDNFKQCIREHNQTLRDDSYILTAMLDASDKIDTLVAAAYNEADYETAELLSTNLVATLQGAYALSN